MEILTNNNQGLVQISDAIAPIINPVGAPARAESLAPGVAAAAAGKLASDATRNAIGVQDGQAEDMKNILFLGLLGLVIWKGIV